VQWAVPTVALESRARTLAREIASLPAPALAAAKRCIGAAITPGADGFEMELEATGTLLAREETQARVRAFLEKRR